jgi:hypothetical protein
LENKIMSDLEDIDEIEEIQTETNEIKTYKGKIMKEWTFDDAGNWILENCTELNIKLIINKKEMDPKEIFKMKNIDGIVLFLFESYKDFEELGFIFGDAKKLFNILKKFKGSKHFYKNNRRRKERR